MNKIEIANEIRILANEIEAIPTESNSMIAWPIATNLIGGTEPPPISLTMESDPAAELLSKQDLRMQSMKSGSIPFLGDSIIQPMPIAVASPFAVGMGYSGLSMRRLLNHMKRPSFKNGLQRAGAGVICAGMNDAGNVAYYGSYMVAVDTVVAMYATHFKNWITGPWVIIAPLRGDQRIGSLPTQYNQAANAIGAGIVSAFANVPNVKVLDVNPAIVDGTGNLATANHIGDGQHPSKAGYDIICPLIADALNSLGVQ